ncbi:hypothetical protein [Nocardia sp. AB354]|uniref:hypothetical protein n=1 Tax=Nocardia sp. AB354 TaxID=3413283 RepID=UPI003C131092
MFAASNQAPDSLELWLAVTAEATRHLSSLDTTSSSWLPVFTVYRAQRTDARYDPVTATVEITSGPLTGTRYTDTASAADAVATAHPGTHQASNAQTQLRSWRLTPTASH